MRVMWVGGCVGTMCVVVNTAVEKQTKKRRIRRATTDRGDPRPRLRHATAAARSRLSYYMGTCPVQSCVGVFTGRV